MTTDDVRQGPTQGLNVEPPLQVDDKRDVVGDLAWGIDRGTRAWLARTRGAEHLSGPLGKCHVQKLKAWSRIRDGEVSASGNRIARQQRAGHCGVQSVHSRDVAPDAGRRCQFEYVLSSLTTRTANRRAPSSPCAQSSRSLQVVPVPCGKRRARPHRPLRTDRASYRWRERGRRSGYLHPHDGAVPREAPAGAPGCGRGEHAWCRRARGRGISGKAGRGRRAGYRIHERAGGVCATPQRHDPVRRA